MMAKGIPDDLIVIASYSNAAEAEIARAVLEGEGLQSCLADEGLVTNFWLLGNAVGYVKLLVAAGDGERARAILRDADQSRPNDAEDTARSGGAPEDANEIDAVAMVDDEARRAWRAAVLGMLFCPPLLNVYSVYLLLKLSSSEQGMTGRGRRAAVGAALVNLLVFLFIAAAFVAIESSFRL